MPELPELQVVREVLQRRVAGQTIVKAEVLGGRGAIIVRDLVHEGFALSVTNTIITDVERRGKFLLFSLASEDTNHNPTFPEPLYLVLNPKLTGRLQLALPKERRHAKTAVVFTLSIGDELRYYDQKQMGQLYLTRDLNSVPEFAGMAPEPFDVSLEQFRELLKPFRGEIKGILARGEFIAGIGNAYADEILWAARIHPYRKRTQLTNEEIERLYHAMRDTLHDATERVRVEMGENIHLKPREFLKVHMKTGEPCPRCHIAISLVGANQRITNFCRSCQPGGLIRGM